MSTKIIIVFLKCNTVSDKQSRQTAFSLNRIPSSLAKKSEMLPCMSFTSRIIHYPLRCHFTTKQNKKLITSNEHVQISMCDVLKFESISYRSYGILIHIDIYLQCIPVILCHIMCSHLLNNFELPLLPL